VEGKDAVNVVGVLSIDSARDRGSIGIWRSGQGEKSCRMQDDDVV